METGQSPDKLMRDVIDDALEQNWVYGLQIKRTRKTFSREAEAFFAKEPGNADFAPADIMATFKAAQAQAGAVSMTTRFC